MTSIEASRDILRYFPLHCGLCNRISASTSTLSFIALKNKIQSFGHFEISHPHPISSKEIDVILSDRFLIGWSEGGLHLRGRSNFELEPACRNQPLKNRKVGPAVTKTTNFWKNGLKFKSIRYILGRSFDPSSYLLERYSIGKKIDGLTLTLQTKKSLACIASKISWKEDEKKLTSKSMHSQAWIASKLEN